MSISTVCFTGHRPSDLGTTPDVAKSALRKAITEAIKRGATTFIAGGAIGVDTYASQLVIEAKASNPSIKLYIAVPFRGFTKYWSNAQRIEYADIIRKCDGFKVICDKPSKHAYHVRNSFMVDRADLVIAYWSGKRNGGTYATVQYAQQTHTPVVNCYPKAESNDSADHVFILHQVNCQNAFGSGFAGYLNRTFPLAKERYHQFIKQMRDNGFTSDTDLLGQAVEAVGDDFTVVHCFGQRFYGNSKVTGRCYTDYASAEQAIAKFRERHPNAIAICPLYMGCGLAGGDWNSYLELCYKYNIIPCDRIDLEHHTYRPAYPFGPESPEESKGSSDSKGDEKMQFRGDYWFLSNFYPCKITFGGLEFSCVESAFQAMKCADKADREKFVKLTGAEAKKLGRKIKMRSDWNKVKDDVMFALVNEKFQDPKLMAMLKAVKEPIVENNTWNDTYWGVCNGKGDNRLGKILMEVRKASR